MMASIQLIGMEKLTAKLKKCQGLDAVRTIVKQNGVEMQNRTVRGAVFTRGYSTGATKQSITGHSEDGGLTYSEGPTTYYSGYVEMGTRKMAAQPFVRPAFNSQKAKFHSDLEKLVK